MVPANRHAKPTEAWEGGRGFPRQTGIPGNTERGCKVMELCHWTGQHKRTAGASALVLNVAYALFALSGTLLGLAPKRGTPLKQGGKNGRAFVATVLSHKGG